MKKQQIYTITHKHANMYLVGREKFVLFDCGWQDSFSEIKSAIKSFGLSFSDIPYLVISHFHPDHAGSAEILRRHGVSPIILDRQVDALFKLNEFFLQEKNDPSRKYAALDMEKTSVFDIKAANELLNEFGMSVLYTPGHSADSISLIASESGFAGDLPPFEICDEVGKASYAALRESGLQTVYFGHNPHYTFTSNII
ncbi:MAG: MBL fold metallo-hydrolase [Ruminococcus sp.]|jgi:glyoxylase-like metal-dependent hydrolase (beta-lactamase superfamily II)|nr:MBL fold metallo-hydrolase [Ruminococcus sp.]